MATSVKDFMVILIIDYLLSSSSCFLSVASVRYVISINRVNT